MTITWEDGLNNDGEELFAIFAMEDLRFLCQVFNSLHEVGRLQSVAFKVVIHGSSEVRGQELDHTHTLSLLHSRQLLEPLTELYAIARFTISGPVNEDSKVKIINQIARPAPRHEDSLEMIRELWIQGEAALNGNRVAFAQKKYIAAIFHLETRDWDMSVLETGCYANRSRYTAYCKLLHGLLHWLAFTFLKMGIFDKAHDWASLAFHSMLYVKGRVSHPPAQYVRLARFLAKTSIALGERYQALEELGWALHIEPNNALVKADLSTLCADIGRGEGV